MPRRGPAAWLERQLTRSWWSSSPDWLARLLWPLEQLYALLAARQRERHAARSWRAPCPVVVVGNLVVGGAGKTPTVIALCDSLRSLGWRPGVVSRGHGRRRGGLVIDVTADADADEVGDEPLLIHRRCGVPVVVAADRVAASRELLRVHPSINVLIADDGLQHHALGRDLELWLFDERGCGNGRLLPAGPLRQPLPARPPGHARVLYNALRETTPLAGECLTRTLAGAQDLRAWHEGRCMDAQGAANLQTLRGRPLWAVAGIASPGRFFDMLRAQGLSIRELALPDHDPYDTLPWPLDAVDVVCTEKDAVKIDPGRIGSTRVWVVGLDLRLPPATVDALRRLLGPPAERT